MNSRLLVWWIASLSVVVVDSTRAADEDIDRQLAVIAKVGEQGIGSAAARVAHDQIARHGTEILPRLLAAMDTESPVAANWYRSIYEKIVEREFAKPSPTFPMEAVRELARDTRRGGRVRRLALALCDRLDPEFSQRLLPRLLDDPEFRDDAVSLALAAGQQALVGGDSETARAEFMAAFQHARDSGQVVGAAEKLAGLGETVNIAAHLGLVIDWWLIGPFDAPRFSGFIRDFPPEHRIDLTGEYPGQEGKLIRWTRHRTADPLGLVDLVQAVAPASEAVGYAYAELLAPCASSAQLRCGADDNCIVWLNDERVFGREQWLNGIRFDRFVTPIHLREGVNRLLVKICQGPQHKDPQVSNNWSFQLRLCDPAGTGVDFKSALAPIPGAMP